MGVWREIQPFDQNADGTAIAAAAQYRLPLSVYTVVLLACWGHESDDFSPSLILTSLATVLPHVTLLVFNYIVQIGFIIFLDGELAGIETCDFPTDPNLRFCALATFVAFMLTEFWENVEMVQWTRHIKIESSHTILSIGVSEDAQAGVVAERRWASGLTSWQKALFGLLVILPKTAISVMLFYTGSRYVGYSGTNSDLLLNSVAMLFVTQIDDLLYTAFTPAYAKRVIEELPPVEPAVQAENEHEFLMIAKPWIKIAIFAALTYLCLGHDC